MAALSSFAMTWWLAGFFLAAFPGPFSNAEILQQGVTTPTLDQLRAEHQQVLNELNTKNSEGRVPDLDDPRIPELFKKGWSLAGAWAAAYLENHPTPSKRELEHVFDGFAPEPRGVKSDYGDFLEYHDYNFSGRAIRIGHGIYVVEASYFGNSSTGTFMVVARNHAGHFQALWNIKDLAEKHYGQRDEIGRWVHLVRRAYYNGPLSVDKILPLSRGANGHSRFLVNAYQSADGGTIAAQMSIWEWDGAEAKPILVKLYQYAADFGGFSFDGRTVRISTKEELGTFFSCGMCPEPRGVWTVRITPEGARDLGHRFVTPEIQWADELLSKIEKGEDTTNLADAKVVAALKARSKEVEIEDLALNPARKSKFTWGMLGQCRILRRGQRGAFELALDEGRLRLSYMLLNGRYYFTHVMIK
jgi:hypothetical protein